MHAKTYYTHVYISLYFIIFSLSLSLSHRYAGFETHTNTFLMCQFAYYTVFQNLQLKCNSGDEIIKKFSTDFGFLKRSKRKKTFLNLLILDIEITLQQFVYTFVITKCFWLWYAGIPDNKKQLFFLIEKSKEDIKTFNGTGTWANFFTRVKL